MKILTYSIFLLLGTLATQVGAEESGMPMMQGKSHEQMKMSDEMNNATLIESDISESMEDNIQAAKKTQDENVQDNNSPEMATGMEGFSRGSVIRSIFTSAIEDREPVDQVKELANNNDKIIYYTELRDMAGQIAKHRWEYNGKVMAEVEFNVKGQRWRVWSSKSFVPQWTGEWKVSVLNGANEVISEDILNYNAVTEATEMAPLEAVPATNSPAVETAPSAVQ